MHVNLRFPLCSYSWLSGLICSALVLLAQSSAFSQSAIVTPPVIEVRGDSIFFSAKLSVPANKIFKKEGTYIVTPELGSFKFKPLTVSSSNLQEPGTNGIITELHSSAFFDEEMLGKSLSLRHEYRYGKHKLPLPKIDSLASCCSTTGRLFLFNSVYSMMHYEYTPTPAEAAAYIALIKFTSDSAWLSQQYQEQICKIQDLISIHPDARIIIRSQASPIAELEKNKEQAILRANAAKDWLLHQFLLNRGDTSSTAITTNIHLQATTEDWTGYKQQLIASPLSSIQQKKILAAISSGLPDTVIAAEIRTLVGSDEMAAQYLRPLENISIIVTAPLLERPGYSTKQIDSVMQLYASKKLPASLLADVFKKQEFLVASQRTSSKEDRLRLLSAYLTQKFADYRIYSDIAVITEMNNNKVDLVEGENSIVGIGFNRPDGSSNKNEIVLDRTRWKFHTKLKQPSTGQNKNRQTLKIDFRDSESLLLQAAAITYNSSVVYNNLGAYYLGQGRFSDALPYLKRSLQVEDNITAHYNTGLYHARMGEYEKAVAHFNESHYIKGVKYNRALAKLLTGDTVGAANDIDHFLQENPKHILGFYLAAVIAARQQQPELLLNYLQEAIILSGNNSISSAAREDPEFKAYWNDTNFLSLVNPAK